MKVAYKLASLHQLTKQNTIKTDGSFCEIAKKKKMSISILFQKVCLGWKLSPIINRRGVGISMSWVEKIEKLISGVGRLLGTTEYIIMIG